MQTHEGIKHHDASCGWNPGSVEGSGLIWWAVWDSPTRAERPQPKSNLMKSIFETGFSGNAAGDGLEGVESEAQETPERSLLNQSRYTCINA